MSPGAACFSLAVPERTRSTQGIAIRKHTFGSSSRIQVHHADGPVGDFADVLDFTRQNFPRRTTLSWLGSILGAPVFYGRLRQLAELGSIMAQAAVRRDRVAMPAIGKAGAVSAAIDAVTKDLIDNLIVPAMVEEFLRLYGPASASEQAKIDHEKALSLPDSELNSTP